MSLEAKIPDEITEYKGKIIGGLNLREFFTVLPAVIIVGCIAIIGMFFTIPPVIVSFLLMGIIIPARYIGFYQKNGFYIEDILDMYIKHELQPTKEKYMSTLLIDYIEEENSKETSSKKKGFNIYVWKKKQRKISEIGGFEESEEITQ